MSASGGTRAIIAAFLANTGIAVTKFIAWFFSGSSSMLAEGVHSLADAGNQLLLIFGGRQAQEGGRQGASVRLRPRALRVRLRRVDHPVLGRRRLLDLRGHREAAAPAPARRAVAADARARDRDRPRVVLAAHRGARSPTTCAASRAGCSSCAAPRRPSSPSCCSRTSPRSSAWSSRSSASASRVITGNSVFDAIGTLFIGTLLIVVAIVLGMETKSLLVGEGANDDDVEAIEQAILAGPEAERIIHMKTLYLGPDELLVAAKVGFHADQKLARGVDRRSTSSSGACARPCPPPASSTSSPTSTSTRTSRPRPPTPSSSRASSDAGPTDAARLAASAHRVALVLRHDSAIGLGNLGPTLEAHGYEIVTVDAPHQRCRGARRRSHPTSSSCSAATRRRTRPTATRTSPTRSRCSRRASRPRRRSSACASARSCSRRRSAPRAQGPAQGGRLARRSSRPSGRRLARAALRRRADVQWHGDTFDLPDGVERLATSAQYENQAFASGDWLLAVQFHPEVDDAIHEDWLREWGDELPEYGLDAASSCASERASYGPRAQAASAAPARRVPRRAAIAALERAAAPELRRRSGSSKKSSSSASGCLGLDARRSTSTRWLSRRSRSTS